MLVDWKSVLNFGFIGVTFSAVFPSVFYFPAVCSCFFICCQKVKYSLSTEAKQGGTDIRTCCDSTQISSLVMQMSVGSSLLQRCPTCVANFRQAFCSITCAPQQSQFMRAKEILTAQDTSELVALIFYIYLTLYCLIVSIYLYSLLSTVIGKKW